MIRLLTILTVLIPSLTFPAAPERSEDYAGERQLSHKQRITAEGRYTKLSKRIKCVHDKDTIVNQLLYIKNGYYDRGYLPEQDIYCESAGIPEGFWVYVYPHWYIWQEQQLF